MIQIRPVSDLRNKFTDIENVVKTGEPRDNPYILQKMVMVQWLFLV